MASTDSEYTRKRNFTLTAEPPEAPARGAGKNKSLSFVIQKHDASHLHYDFRLELDGTLKSWAVPKGPSLDPSNKRLAVHVEDHPLGYASFEGSIPKGQYGGGDVIVWDRGIWQPHGDPRQTYKAGKLKFTLIGEKLTGEWALVRTHLKGSGDKEQWLLIKEKDEVARPAAEYDILVEQPRSVISGALVGEVKGETKKAKAAKPKPKAVAPKKKNADGVPETLAPQLATLMDEPAGDDWLYEIKFDGYRLLTRIKGKEVRVFSRNGNDWTDRLPMQVKALAAMGLEDTWLDGEMVLLNDDGLPDFQGLQNALDIGRSKDIVYYLFDLPFLSGQDLRETPLEQRRDALKQLLDHQRSRLLRFSDTFRAGHRDIVESASAMGLEGVIGKRPGSVYQSRRSPDWIKLKCRLRQEFVIIGYTQPQGSRSGFGALLLAVTADDAEDELVYAGRVGTGFSETTLKQLLAQMQPLQRDASPLTNKLTAAQSRGVHWIEPKLICEAEFAQWTQDNIIRHAVFIGLRSDKPVSQVSHERPSHAKPKAAAASSAKAKAAPTTKPVAKGKARVAGVDISHPERVIDKESGVYKVELAQFYEAIAEWILPFLKQRPVALLRCPEGVGGEQFFQKHSERLAIPHIKQLEPGLDPGHARLMEVDSLEALVGAAQMGAIELHTWGATHDKTETPDQMVLDLDPDPDLPWRSMIEATQMVLAVLDELGLQSFLKTSGGKGMHIIVPLARQADWETVKAFAKAIAEFMTRQLPERFTATSGPKNRVGKIFIDYLRNTRGASTVVAYSVRARPGLPVSVPISRDELSGLRSARQWHVGNLQERLQGLKGDPWAGYQNRQRLTKKLLAKLES
ncbi:bifunctional non-homologous end joining protein LigD [Pseudomonas sp. JUb42]|uniref:DNA ligase D n=1 Tax=Pseudomonas sp. JUb42 TaxID=2940611 RepID=UPI0021694C5D|nr:DNA ligase D [Pseudomonas sp. JUb42]MCS3468077.1 bifunctional non-homologous end joining protein LigD [Pseudomonas sp. JUb42]